MLQSILILFGMLSVLILGGFAVISWRESEPRAARISAAGAALAGVIFWSLIYLPNAILIFVIGALLVAGTVLIVLFFLPIGNVEARDEVPPRRVDERDIPFSRMRLIPGSAEYTDYYEKHPENEAVDNRFRGKPGLLSLKARLANPFHFASAEGSFWLTEGLREDVDGPVSEIQYNLPETEMSEYLKGLARYFGAKNVGICELQPYHFYSHVGRGTGTYGDPVRGEHRYGIAFTVEMDHKMIGASPRAPTIMESGKQYVEAARIAVQLAAAIRYLGFPARAHIDGNYQVIAPLVGRDAGLGEVGRMGLLMTPRLGPRVRLGAVTTDLELVPDDRKVENSIIDFCTICKKCAENCPSRSIPFEDRQEVDGALRWKIDADSCFLYWNVMGTDCAKCMAVCPYSHPETISHNIIRWGIRKSGSFRRGALWLDDLFYGKRPIAKAAPEWVNVDGIDEAE